MVHRLVLQLQLHLQLQLLARLNAPLDARLFSMPLLEECRDAVASRTKPLQQAMTPKLRYFQGLFCGYWQQAMAVTSQTNKQLLSMALWVVL
jgi:hypothetical protein